MKEIDHL